MEQRSPTSPGLSGVPPRSHSRTFSYRSDKSGKSGTSGKKEAFESPQEKERRDSLWKGGSKANPNAALNEAQPGVYRAHMAPWIALKAKGSAKTIITEVNLLEKATIEPLRNFQHKDGKGNIITDPDLSNPTRPRMERPLDTIRSFEKAIDSGYKRRTSMIRGESYNEQNNNAYGSRRSSYVGGYDNSPNRPYQNGSGGYYGSRRPDSYVDGPNGPNGYPQRMRYGSRMQSDSAVGRSNAGGYPNHNYQQSYDTGSDSTGPWANSTGPSSENSSIERMQYHSKPPYDPQDGMQNPIMEGQQMHSYQNEQAPRPPEHQQRPSPYRGSDQGPPVPRKTNLPSTARPEPEKKKGWLSRRFSKKL